MAATESYAGLDPHVIRGLSENAKRLRDAPKHPHLVTVCSVDRVGDAWSITSEDVDGVPLAEVFFRLSLGARLRVVVDLLAALSALHTLHTPIIFGGVLLRFAFVDKQGRTKLANAYAQPLFIKKDSYAPESLLGDVAAIAPQTDVYGAGVLLWEAVMGRQLFGIAPPDEIVKKQLAGKIDKALPAARDRWARTVLPVIDRALSVNPHDRYATIAEMAAALRIAVRARLMIHEDVIEEIWPATTTPKFQSGTQPAAEPVVSEAAPMMVVATPSAAIVVVPETSSAVAVPRKSNRRVASVAASVFAIVMACSLALTFVHGRAHVAARADATPDDPPPSQVVGAAAPAETVEIEQIKPVEAPAASGAPKVHAKIKLPKSRVYNPSSI